MPDLILYNGRFHAQEAGLGPVTAVAIRDGRFVAVGSDEDLREMAASGSRLVDLEGRLVLPGLVDAHFHYYDWALGRRRLPLAATTSLSDLRQRLARRVQETPSGHWVLGQGWNETRWPEMRVPTRADLDDVAPAHPVVLWRADMHMAVANTRALEEAGISASTPNPPQGVIDRGATGQPTGVVRELAINLISDVIPPPLEEEIEEAMFEGFAVLHRLGLTGVHDQRIMGGADGPPAFGGWQRLQAAGKLDLRVWMNVPGERLEEAIALGLRSGFGGDSFRLGHVKFFADGGQGARTAWMLEPYLEGGHGMPLTPPETLAEALHSAHRAGLAVAIHSIGDRANRELLAVFQQVLDEEVGQPGGGPAVPHRIEHAQVMRPQEVERLARLGVVASVQPLHATDDIVMVEQTVGPRGRFVYAFRDLLDAGATLALGSDCPVADPNPLWGIHAAVTRQRRDGTPAGGWYPGQRLTVAEAVWGYTVGPAMVSGREKELGSIRPGKRADLVILDRNIFEIEPMEIAAAQPVMTVFDGRVVYEG